MTKGLQIRLLALLLTLIAAAGTLSRPVLADGSLKDTPVAAAAPQSCTGGRFAGLYIGASVGYIDHRDEKSDLNFPGNNFGDSSGSVIGGLHDGYSVQCGRLVVGIESDISAFSADTSQFDPGAGPCCLTITTQSNADWLSTSRLRIGLVHDDRLMFYVTGGIAAADINHKVSDPLIIPGGFSESHSDWQWGWTAGGGVEMLRDDHWSLRAEALYVDLGSTNESYTATGCVGPACTTAYKWDDNFWLARIGLSYKFGPREAEVVPLK
jgi:outer membrane immunogenic protein